MDTIAKTSLKVLLFNDKASTYDYWNPKFAAKGKKKTFPVFLGTTLVPPKSEYDAALLIVEASSRTDHQKKTIKCFDLNSSAYDELIMSINSSTDGDKIAFQLVHNSRSVINPDGDARLP